MEVDPLRLYISLQVAGLTDFDWYPIRKWCSTAVPRFGADPQPGTHLPRLGPADTPVTFPSSSPSWVDPVLRGQQTLPADARLQREHRTSADVHRRSPLTRTDDGSWAFTRRGYVEIAGPRDSVPVAGVGKEPRLLHWFRCRLDAGRYATGQEPEIELFRYNTVEATSLSSVTDELAGQSDGRTQQVVRLRHRPVLPSTVRVSTMPPPGDVAQDEGPWTVVADLVQSGPQDRHVVVDGSRGELRFGDGRNGQVPVAGFDIVVSYRYGGSAWPTSPGRRSPACKRRPRASSP